jgi:phosphoribosylformylglycinamidine (FGAM) synthase-like amidotransferase family enzyme
MMRTFHTVEGNGPIEKMMLGAEFWRSIPVPPAADVVLFPGGPDVNPALYGDVPHPRTGFSAIRDEMFQQIWESVKDQPSLKVGICGGGQFLNVMSGGKMWQDVDNHALAGTHSITYVSEFQDHSACEGSNSCIHGYKYDDQSYQVTSTHHQMMRPDPDLSELWGYTEARCTFRDTGWDRRRKYLYDEGPNIEIVYYPKTRCLCFQPHPEYDSKSCRDLFFICLHRALARIGK